MKLVPGSPNLPITTLVVVEPVHAAGCFVIGWQVGGTSSTTNHERVVVLVLVVAVSSSQASQV